MKLIRGCSLYSVLVILHVSLLVAHATCAIIAVNMDIRFPITVFETRLRDAAIGNFTCIYDFSTDPDTDERYCRDSSLTDRNVTAECAPIVASYANTSSSPFVDDENSIRVDAYQIVRFDPNYTYTSGVAATRWVLFTIEFVTALFHLIYAATTLRIMWEASSTRRRTTDFVLKAGGIPARWYEYAFTASLMSFFIGNTANVFEFYALLAFALGTFALMYFGLAIEQAAFEGDVTRALVYIYVPGTALFTLTWLPSIRQLSTDLLRLSCVDSSESYFRCTDQTCFGADNPIGLFIFVLLALFAVFPLVTIGKIFIVGGWEARWTDNIKRIAKRGLGVERRPIFNLIYYPLIAPLVACVFAIFVVYGAGLAVIRIIADIFWPIFPCRTKVSVPVSRTLAKRAFVLGELLYALASGTSKLFLFIYFYVFFAQRSW